MMSFFTKLRLVCIGISGALILRLLNWTLRWQKTGLDGANGRWSSETPRIIVFWHSRQLFMFWLYQSCKVGRQNRPAVALVSQHNDGRMLAAGLKWLGVDSVAGSSTRGGTEAMFHLNQKIKAGCHIGISPDGPRGPCHKAKGGAVRIAQRSGLLIYPVAYSAERRWTFKSWDRMILPKPFSRAVLAMGEPIAVPADIDEEGFRQKVADMEKALNDVTRRADSFNYC